MGPEEAAEHYARVRTERARASVQRQADEYARQTGGSVLIFLDGQDA